MTEIERIVSEHSDKNVRPGDVVWMRIDVRTARDFGGPKVVQHIEKQFNSKLYEPERIFFTFDTSAPAKDIGYAKNQHIIRLFARKHNIKVFDVDRGIGTHVMIEEGLAQPSRTLIGTDSHYNILGSVGALGLGMGDIDVAFAFATGKVWFEVPETVTVSLKGMVKPGVEPKDVVLYLLRRFGTTELLGKAVQLEGEYIRSLGLAGRITIASMATELGAVISFLEVGDRAKKEYKELTGLDWEWAGFKDKGSKVIEVDIDGLGHQIAAPPSPANVHDVSEFSDVKVDSIFIGSCTNGRIEDIRAVAEVMGERRVAPNVMAKIVPSTKKVFAQMIEEGLLQKLFSKGFIIANPGCGGCAFGQIGMTGPGEVQLSTANRNFPGKQGAGDTYLVGPKVAAASAVLGRIAQPEDLD